METNCEINSRSKEIQSRYANASQLMYMIGDFFYRFFRKSYKEIRRKKILSKYEIHMSVKFWENTFITGAGEIFIGEGTYIGQNSYVSANPNGCSVRIGKNCMISHNVHIRTGSYTLRI